MTRTTVEDKGTYDDTTVKYSFFLTTRRLGVESRDSRRIRDLDTSTAYFQVRPVPVAYHGMSAKD